MEDKSNRQHIEEAVADSVRKFTADIEQRRIIFQSVLNENIDILLHNSESWFGNEIPSEFRKVIHSLIALANSFMLEEYDYDFKPGDINKTILDINIIIEGIISEFKSTFKFHNIVFLAEGNREYKTIAPVERLRNSIYNILLSLYLFFNDRSSCIVRIYSEYSNIIIDLIFKDLSESFPGAARIQRIFFPYIADNSYTIGIGIYSAITGLKDAGAQVTVPSLNDPGSFRLTISFPTVEFLNSLDDIRTTGILTDRRRSKSGKILMASSDFILEMVMTEFLTENGYIIHKADLSSLETLKEPESYKALIADIEHLKRRDISLNDFAESSRDFAINIIIYGSEDKIPEVPDMSNCIIMKKPVEVDEIIRKIENKKKC